jgi:phosphatidylserine decarboxylase
MTTRISDTLFVALQRALPARLLGRAVYAMTRSRNRILKDLLIRGFTRLYDVNTAEAEKPVPGGYATFNDFFTRALASGARPVDADPGTVVSPADGRIQQIGRIRDGQILQVKGLEYRVADLLGDDAEAAARYRDGTFVTIYLAPWNYHRVHVPVAGRITDMTHVPGELWSVNATTAARVPRLFARNERLVCHGEAGFGRFAVVLVGALNVGSISTAWAGEVLPRTERSVKRWRYEGSGYGTALGKGDVLGQFNMGSTVILLFPRGVVTWRPELAAGDPVRVGAPIGQLTAGMTS